MKVWVTKYALTEGIREAEVDMAFGGLAVDRRILDRHTFLREMYSKSNKEWHSSQYEAVEHSEKMRHEEIRRMKREKDILELCIDRLENIDFRQEVKDE